MSNESPHQPASRKTKRFLWGFSIVMVLTAGSAFLMKLVEFIYQFLNPQNAVSPGPGIREGFMFTTAPVLIYLIVAAGFGCLFVWAYLSGHFKDVEGPKYRMLELQDEIEDANPLSVKS